MMRFIRKWERFGHLLWTSMTESKDRYDLAVWGVPIGLSLLAAICRKFGLQLSFLPEPETFLWIAGGIFTFWAISWRPFCKYDELRTELDELKSKRAVKDGLGLLHERFDMLWGRISGMDAQEFEENREVQASFAKLMVDAHDFVRDKIGAADGKVFIANYDLERTPLPRVNSDDAEAVARKQWYLDMIMRSAKKLERLIERLSS